MTSDGELDRKRTKPKTLLSHNCKTSSGTSPYEPAGSNVKSMTYSTPASELSPLAQRHTYHADVSPALQKHSKKWETTSVSEQRKSLQEAPDAS